MIMGYNEKDKEKYNKMNKKEVDKILEKNEQKMKEYGLFCIKSPVVD